MDHISQQLDQLSDLTDEQISGLQNDIISEFDTVEQGDPTSETVDSMTSLADMLDTVRAEVNRRQAQAAELSAAAADAVARVKGVNPDDDSDGSDDDPEGDDNSMDSDSADDPDDIQVIQASAETEETPVSTEETPELTEAATETSAEAELATAVPEPKFGTPEWEAKYGKGKGKTLQPTQPAAAASVEGAEELAVEDEATEVAAPEAELATDETAEASAEAPAETAELAVEDAPTEETTPEAELSSEATDEASASISEENTNELSAQEEAPVTAAADEGSFEAPADRRPVAQVKVQAPVAITAGANIPGYSVGSTISDMDEVAVAFAGRLSTLRNINGGDGEHHTVATLRTDYPESRILSGHSATENEKRINDVIGPKALAASGGFAAPIEANYDIFGFGTDARPVLASLPAFQADRGGMRYITPPQLSAYSGAVGVWTNAMDITAESSGTKNVLVVGSASENTQLTEAITLQLQFGNLLTRAFPELIARHNELALIQHARVAEQQLLAGIASNSTAVTSTSNIGFARDFLVQVRRSSAAYRSRNRIDPATQLRAIIPAWVYDAMAADLTLNMPGDGNLGVSHSEIQSFLSGSNVSLTASLDQNVFPAQSTGALDDFPASFTWYLFAEGTFIFLDGGTLDIGIVRDSGLVGTNDYRMFTETFEGVAFVGISSLAITSSISVNGTASALIAQNAGPSAAVQDY